MMGELNLFPESNDLGFIDRHMMFVDLNYFEGRIINYVEKNHSQEEIDEIVRLWKVPSYNLLKKRDSSGLNNGNKYCSYVVNIDEYGWLQSVVIMTERNCGYVLHLVLEMVN